MPTLQCTDNEPMWHATWFMTFEHWYYRMPLYLSNCNPKANMMITSSAWGRPSRLCNKVCTGILQAEEQQLQLSTESHQNKLSREWKKKAFIYMIFIPFTQFSVLEYTLQFALINIHECTVWHSKHQYTWNAWALYTSSPARSQCVIVTLSCDSSS